MVLQLIDVSSQSQLRMDPPGPVKAAAHPRVPHTSRDTTLQVAMDESLWLLAQLHPQLQPWHRPQERGQPEPQKTLR